MMQRENFCMRQTTAETADSTTIQGKRCAELLLPVVSTLILHGRERVKEKVDF